MFFRSQNSKFRRNEMKTLIRFQNALVCRAAIFLIATAISLSTFFINPPLLFAQGTDCPGTLCVCLTDNSCSSEQCGGNTITNCASTTITAPCTGTYTMTTKTSCPSGYNCAKCQCCLNIYNGTNFVANCHNTHCDTEDCSWSCTTTLTASVTYTLYVCLDMCLSGTSCEESCGNGCSAQGCVSYAVTTCP